jgi:LmbE family N-acetylglucosaminyl deacetylase
MAAGIDFSTTAIVVAHPDDEVLWFASLVAKAARIIVCYGAISPTSARAEKRRKVMRHHPLATVEFLDLPIPPADAAGGSIHAGFDALAQRLSAALRGIDTVFTHNPWGEYGQADHRRVQAAIAAIQQTTGISVFASSYAARHQLPELQRVLRAGIGETMSLPIDRGAIKPIVALYKAEDCWTWAPLWRWPKREHFFRLPAGGPPAPGLHAQLFGTSQQRRAEMRSIWRRLLPMKPHERFIPSPAASVRRDGDRH